MNRKYNLKLDLQFRCNNSIMKFNQFDNNTSDFFMRITNGGNLVDIEKAIVVLAIIKPSGKVASQFVEVENGLVYADLKSNMRDEIGTYTAKAMLILEDERVVTDVISYEVEEDKIFSLLNDTVEATEECTMLTDMLNRLSAIEISEEQRQINEAERILSEENRKIEEAKRVEAELIRQHEEADRTKYDAIRESNENIRKINEETRISSENVRLENEANRIEQEANRVKAEQLRKDNYNLMTEDEERRRSEANAHKEAEVLRVQAETNRVNEEAKRRISEQARVSAENTRVNNENTRKANETTRQTNETHRVEAETQRQNRYNSFIADAEVNANNFENYTNSAKVKEEERKSNELNRKSQEDRRVSNEVERISNENARKANEAVREKNETSRQYVFENKVDEIDKKIIEINATKDNFVSSVNTKVDNKISEIDSAKSDMTTTVSNKVNEVETRFNALTSSQQQDAEVIDARVDFKGVAFNSLKERIDYTDKLLRNSTVSTVTTESDFTTVEQTSNGYFEDVKLEGKTLVNIHPKATPALSVSDRDNPKYNVTKNEGYIKVTGSDLGTTNYRYINMGRVNFEILKPNTTYTVMFTKFKGVHKICLQNGNSRYSLVNNTIDTQDDKLLYTLVTKEALEKSEQILYLWVDPKSTTVDVEVENPMIFEGDLTTNPPSGYIEGLKSVGQLATILGDGADEIVVSSVDNGNMINLSNITEGKYISPKNGEIRIDDNSFYCNTLIPISPNMNIVFRTTTDAKQVGIFLYYDKDKQFISGQELVNNTYLTMPQNTKYLRLSFYNRLHIKECLYVGLGDKPVFIEYQSDKKRLLYYNNETQTWEKPVLREWDSIEKHADGKYYYHQRSGEVVLNGSESWELQSDTAWETDTHISFYYCIADMRQNFWSTESVSICDRFNTITANNSNYTDSNEFSSTDLYKFNIKILKSRLSTQDVAGFKQWLQANNITVVYQLAQEKVYECTNIDLITYANETNYIVECGAIVPKTTLKVHNNISNVVSLLQKKVSLLESNIKASQEVQDMMILETDMRMLDIELALMEFIPMTLNLGGSNMLRSATYFNFLKNHIINETYEKEYLENVMNKYLATGRINQDEYNELYKMLYPPVYDIELPIEY